MKRKYKFEVSNRLDEPFDAAKLHLEIEAESRAHAVDIATQFGFKYHLLLTGPK